jgi:hypothetical protein
VLDWRTRGSERRCDRIERELGECKRQVERLKREVTDVLKVVNEWQREMLASHRRGSGGLGTGGGLKQLERADWGESVSGRGR